MEGNLERRRMDDLDNSEPGNLAAKGAPQRSGDLVAAGFGMWHSR